MSRILRCLAPPKHRSKCKKDSQCIFRHPSLVSSNPTIVPITILNNSQWVSPPIFYPHYTPLDWCHPRLFARLLSNGIAMKKEVHFCCVVCPQDRTKDDDCSFWGDLDFHHVLFSRTSSVTSLDNRSLGRKGRVLMVTVTRGGAMYKFIQMG